MNQRTMINNVSKHRYIFWMGVLIFSTLSFHAVNAQDSAYKRPEVTNNWKEYAKQVKEFPYKKMIDLRSVMPDIVCDLRYAGLNNFMHRRMYPENTNTPFLRKVAADSLRKVQQELNEKGLGLKIFDAYRPYSVTVKFWELVHDDRYVADPAKGSGHNRGIAIDVTIINLKTGDELKMGTGFDNFTDTAHQTFTNLPEKILQNRFLLRSTMEKYGFIALETEWWHYYLKDGDKLELLDIDFKKLKK
jgi:D-alanyl-D-alanine dipeptidase